MVDTDNFIEAIKAVEAVAGKDAAYDFGMEFLYQEQQRVSHFNGITLLVAIVFVLIILGIILVLK